MTIGRRDMAAAGLTILVVLTYAATHEAWNVPLVGGSHRWAAGVIGLLGIATCSLGTPGKGSRARLLSLLGVLALVLVVLALWTGSLTPLSLLVLDVVLLWSVATLGHLQQGRHLQSRDRPVTT